MRLRGIKHGKTIELLEAVGDVPDGAEVSLELEIVHSSEPEVDQLSIDTDKLARLNQLFGAWAERADLDEIFSEIEYERHAFRGRSINSLDR